VQWPKKIAKDLMVGIPEVGITADLLEMKIKKCQLGLFGWGKNRATAKISARPIRLSAEMKNALEETTENGAVTCAAAWAIADRLARTKGVSAACETLGLKVRKCQLGAF